MRFEFLCALCCIALWGCTQNQDNFITANIVDPAALKGISKFRSCCGHDYSAGGESNRSMKHYLYPKANYPISNTALPVYAPFDGEVIAITREEHQIPCFNDLQGYSVKILPYARSDMSMRIFHVNPTVGKGPVNAGQQIGYADLRSCDGQGGTATLASFDVAIEGGGTRHSMFPLLNDDTFGAWAARGISSREATIISREARDAQQCSDYQNTACNADTINLP